MSINTHPPHTPPRRVAVVDLGTNTVRMLVARRDGTGLAVDYSGQAITRLGERLHEAGFLTGEAVARTVDAVARMWDEAGRPADAPLSIFGTSACRTAKNSALMGRAFVDEVGADLTVIDQEREARLSLLGASMAVAHLPRFVLFDIGGGSTEFVLAERGEVMASAGTGLGVVRLAESHFTRHPVDPAEETACAGEVSAAVNDAFDRLGIEGPVPLVGTAGTVTSIAAMDLGMSEYYPARINGHVVTAARLHAIGEGLFSMTLAERSAIPSLNNGREDLIVPGIIIVREAMARAGVAEMTVADYGLREGYALELLTYGRIR